MKTYKVEVVIKHWEEGGYLAEAPALQGCWCVSDTIEAAIDDIQEVIALAIQARESVGAPLPPELEPITAEEQPTKLMAIAVPLHTES